jgi:hypothetical protein
MHVDYNIKQQYLSLTPMQLDYTKLCWSVREVQWRTIKVYVARKEQNVFMNSKIIRWKWNVQEVQEKNLLVLMWKNPAKFCYL